MVTPAMLGRESGERAAAGLEANERTTAAAQTSRAVTTTGDRVTDVDLVEAGELLSLYLSPRGMSLEIVTTHRGRCCQRLRPVPGGSGGSCDPVPNQCTRTVRRVARKG